MKKVFATAAIILSLIACNNQGNGVDDSSTDTPATNLGDTANNTVDTTSINPGDTMGINRDTSRTDRTRLPKKVDTTVRRSH